jgi:hypothetical protein
LNLLVKNVSQKAESRYCYLSYITARDVWQTGKPFFGGWLLGSIFSLAIVSLFEFGIAATKEAVPPSVFSSVPRWFWFWAIVAGAAWLHRGETFTFPKLTFKAWATFAVILGLFMYLGESIPWWAMVPLCWAVVTSLGCIDSLATKGRENYQRLQGQAEEDDVSQRVEPAAAAAAGACCSGSLARKERSLGGG